MKASDVILQLKNVLPQLTDQFSDEIAISDISISGTTVTVTTATSHGLKVGEALTISGGKAAVDVSSLTQVGGLATLDTVQDHDVTKNVAETFIPKIEITGANESEWNDTFDVTDGPPNRKTIEFDVPASHTSPATGTILLFDGADRGMNGIQLVTVIVSPTVFEYELTTSIALTTALPGAKLKKNIRITGSLTIDRAIRAYTRQKKQKLYAFVVLGDALISKDTNVNSDATAPRFDGEDFRMRLVQNMGIFIFVPVTQSLAGAVARRDLIEEIRPAIFKAILGIKFPSQLFECEFSKLSYEGDSIFADNDAYFIYQFAFQTVFDIVDADTADDSDDVAFRDIFIDFAPDLPDTTFIASIDLDDEPIP